MLLVLRPTEKGSGKMATKELEPLLKSLGYDFAAVEPELTHLTTALDKDGTVMQDDLIEYLVSHYSLKYANQQALREALKLFDFDNDGRIKYEEFEYFMRNFGTAEASHITEERMQKLLELCRSEGGQVEVDRAVKALTEGFRL